MLARLISPALFRSGEGVGYFENSNSLNLNWLKTGEPDRVGRRKIRPAPRLNTGKRGPVGANAANHAHPTPPPTPNFYRVGQR